MDWILIIPSKSFQTYHERRSPFRIDWIIVEDHVLLLPEALPHPHVIEQRPLLHDDRDVNDHDVGRVEPVKDLGLPKVQPVKVDLDEGDIVDQTAGIVQSVFSQFGVAACRTEDAGNAKLAGPKCRHTAVWLCSTSIEMNMMVVVLKRIYIHNH